MLFTYLDIFQRRSLFDKNSDCLNNFKRIHKRQFTRGISVPIQPDGEKASHTSVAIIFEGADRRRSSLRKGALVESRVNQRRASEWRESSRDVRFTARGTILRGGTERHFTPRRRCMYCTGCVTTLDGSTGMYLSVGFFVF